MKTPKTYLLLAIIGFSISSPLPSFSMDSNNYHTPPQAIAELVDAPPTPAVNLDPTRSWMLLQHYPNLISIDELAQPELKLAGRRFNPITHGPSRSGYTTSLSLLRIEDKTSYEISGLPDPAKIQTIRWSPDGSKIAFVQVNTTGQDLYVIDVGSKTAKKLLSNKVNSVYGSAYVWLPDNQTLLCKTVVSSVPPPEKSDVPQGPVIQETSGQKAAARTYQDLLKDSHDEALFEYHSKVQLVKINVDGETSLLGEPGIIRRFDPCPSGKYILVERVHRPFSYLVPASRFPYSVEVWDTDGILIKQITDRPLAETIPIGFGAVPTGPRSFDWRSDTPATLYWAEAQDDGDPKKEVEIRDQVFALDAPFTSEPELFMSLSLRYGGVQWGHEKLALVYEWWWSNRIQQVWQLNPATPADTTLLMSYSWEDRYNDPATP